MPRFDLPHDGDTPGASSVALARFLAARGWSNAVIIAGGADWAASGADDVREALARRALVGPGIRLGEHGRAWERIARRRVLPQLNSVDLAHPEDIAPGAPHPLSGWRPGRLGVYNLLARRRIILDLAAVREVEDVLTRDLRTSRSALGADPLEAATWNALRQSSGILSALTKMLIIGQIYDLVHGRRGSSG